MDRETFESCNKDGQYRGRIELPLRLLVANYGELVADKYIRMVDRSASQPNVGGCYIGFDLYLCETHGNMMLQPIRSCRMLDCPDRNLVHTHAG